MFEKLGCRTTDPGRATDWLAERYTDHRLQIETGSAPFRFGHVAAPIGCGTLNFLQYGAEVEIISGAFPDFYMLEIPLSGGVDLDLQGVGACASSTDHALFIAPGRALTSVWRPGTRQFMLKLNARDVLARWQKLTGDPSALLPATPPLIDLTTHEGWRVQQLLSLLRTEFERDHRSDRMALHQATLKRSPLPAAIIDCVLDYLRHHHRDTLDPAGQRPLPAAVRRCCRHIEIHLASDIALADLEAVAGVSRRSLFNQFATFLDTTPIRYLETQRLKKARRLLLEESSSVAEAAAAAGFRHMGRFSGRYAGAYGERPSDTRRRSIRSIRSWPDTGPPIGGRPCLAGKADAR